MALSHHSTRLNGLRKSQGGSRKGTLLTQEELIDMINPSTAEELLEALSVLADSEQRPDDRMLDALAASLQRNVDSEQVSPGQVAEILSSLATLGYQPPSRVLDSASMYMAGKLHSCSPAHISRCGAQECAASGCLCNNKQPRTSGLCGCSSLLTP